MVNGEKTNYKYAKDKLLSQSFSGNNIYFNYGDGGIVGFTLKQSNNETSEFIYQKNLTGDVTHIYRVTKENDVNNYTLYESYTYDAWGKVTVTNTVGNIGDVNPIRYRSYYYDVETEFYYLQSRYYDPEIGGL